MKWLKNLFIILGILLLILVISLILFATLVNPNRFKPYITEEVKKTTGRDLAIIGNISWTVFPYFGLKVGPTQLKNPPNFSERIFAEFQSITMGVKLLPLLHSKVETNGVTINGLKLNLIKNAQGETNWSDLTNMSSTPMTQNTSRTTLGFATAGITISNATVNWANEQTRKKLSIEQFNLHVKDINLNKPFPITMDFNIATPGRAVADHVVLSSQFSKTASQKYALQNIDLVAQFNQASRPIDLKVKGDAVIDDAQQTLVIDNLTGELANLKFNGKLNVFDLMSNLNMRAYLTVPAFDAKQFLQLTSADCPNLQEFKNVTGNFIVSLGPSFKPFNLQGTGKIDTIKASNVRINSIQFKTQMQNGVLEISPLNAVFYQGTLTGNAKINLNTPVPYIGMQAKAVGFQVYSLLSDIATQHKLTLNGLGNIDLQVSTAGLDKDSIVKNLNGAARLAIFNGYVQGIDVGFLVDSALALLHKNTNTPINTQKTLFSTLSANALILNGLISNNDLVINSPRLEAKGSGTINLINNQINYHLQTSLKQASDQTNVTSTQVFSIPISITGVLQNPVIRLEADALMKNVTSDEIQKAKTRIEEKIEKYKDKLPPNANRFINNLFGK